MPENERRVMPSGSCQPASPAQSWGPVNAVGGSEESAMTSKQYFLREKIGSLSIVMAGRRDPNFSSMFP